MEPMPTQKCDRVWNLFIIMLLINNSYHLSFHVMFPTLKHSIYNGFSMRHRCCAVLSYLLRSLCHHSKWSVSITLLACLLCVGDEKIYESSQRSRLCNKCIATAVRPMEYTRLAKWLVNPSRFHVIHQFNSNLIFYCLTSTYTPCLCVQPSKTFISYQLLCS